MLITFVHYRNTSRPLDVSRSTRVSPSTPFRFHHHGSVICRRLLVVEDRATNTNLVRSFQFTYTTYNPFQSCNCFFLLIFALYVYAFNHYPSRELPSQIKCHTRIYFSSMKDYYFQCNQFYISIFLSIKQKDLIRKYIL